jgi:hypothetical protein
LWLYISHEPLTGTERNRTHYNLLVPKKHSFKEPMRAACHLLSASRLAASREHLRVLHNARLAPPQPLAPAPAPAVLLSMPVAQVMCVLGPAPEASAAPAKKRPPRKHNPDVHKRWLPAQELDAGQMGAARHTAS